MCGCIFEDNTMSVPNSFNEPLDAYHKFMKHITVIIFEENDNKFMFNPGYAHPIILPSHIKVLKIQRRFIKQIVLNPCLKVLELNEFFNQPFDLTHTIVELTFKNCFNQPLNLTPSIVSLTFGDDFNQSLDLTKNIEYLSLGYYFDHPIILNKKMIGLTINSCLSSQIVLTKRMVHLKIVGAGMPKQSTISTVSTKNIKVLDLGIFSHPINISKNITILSIIKYSNGTIELNKTMRFLSLGYDFIKPIILTKNMIEIKLFGICDQPFVLSEIKSFKSVSKNERMFDNLPNTLEEINNLTDGFIKLDNVSNSVKNFGMACV